MPHNRSHFRDLPPIRTSNLEERWPTKSSPRYPCRCLSNTADSISRTAIGAANAYYRLFSPIKGKPTAAWIRDLIQYRISNARATALKVIEARIGVVIHTKHDTSAELSSHVQPWAVASIHRATIDAAKEALEEIDDRECTPGQGCTQEKPAFSFRTPGTMFCNPFMKHFPCLCKDATANKVADLVLEDYMKNTPDGPKMNSAMYQSVKKRLNISIAKAKVHALEKIAQPGDEKHRCPAYGRPPHVLKWMNTTVKAVCERAIAREVDIIRLEMTKSRDWEQVISRSDGSLPDASVDTVSTSTIDLKSRLSSCSLMLPTDHQRGITNRSYGENLTSFVADETLAALKRVFPLSNREFTDSWMRDQLKPTLTKAKECALGVIARYEQIIDEAQIVDCGKHFHMHDHPWTTLFVKHAISKAADRAIEKFKMHTEPFAMLQAKVHENKQFVSARTPERMAAQGLIKMAKDTGGKSFAFIEENDRAGRGVREM